MVPSSKLGLGPAIRLGLAACLALSTGCSAFAQEGVNWRCDTPNAHYDEFSPRIGDKTSSITGKINFHKADFGPEWSSIAKIGFVDSKVQDGDCHCNGLIVKAYENGVSLGLLVDGQTRESFPVGGTFDYPIPFKMTIDPKGFITLQVGEKIVQTATAKLAHAERDTILMNCSGADISFLNVKAE